ncbi:MAG TPA: hypothetical protein ENK02_06240 [Planctomycetes bacterium]|nr:hypothetical protein [Planctomycetota bacterium]
MAVEVKEEKKAGVPAYMATFADLMTLLLVFFILLNVYAQQQQAGLLEAMRGSMANAIYSTVGNGGLLEGSKYLAKNNAPRPQYLKQDKTPGELTEEERTGDEVELHKSRSEKLEATEEIEMTAPFVFAHHSAEIPQKGLAYLDELSRSLNGGDFTVEFRTYASFIESMIPLDLAAQRCQNVLRFLREVGCTAELRPSAGVLRAKQAKNGAWRTLSIRVIRKR